MNGSLGAVLVCLAEGAGLDNPAVLHDDVHATTGVAAFGHAAATQAVGDEHRVLL